MYERRIVASARPSAQDWIVDKFRSTIKRDEDWGKCFSIPSGVLVSTPALRSNVRSRQPTTAIA